MSKIRDVLQVKQIEKLLGRKLTDWELEDTGPFLVRLKDGTYDKVEVTRLEFPRDVLSPPACYLVGGSEDHEDEDL